MTDTIIQETIRHQMGGRPFEMLVGVKQITYREKQVTTKFKAKSKNKSNCVRVTLTDADDYTVEFLRLWGLNCTEISTHEGIYADMLQDLFETHTGLYVRF